MTKYSELLSKTWDDIMDSDYSFKSNTMRRIIQIKGEEIQSPYSVNSDIIIFYNISSGEPMVYVERIQVDDLKTMPLEYEINIPGFVVNIEHGAKGENAYVEIIITRADLYSALSMQ